MALLAEQEAEARRRSDDEFESFDTATTPAPIEWRRSDDEAATPKNSEESEHTAIRKTKTTTSANLRRGRNRTDREAAAPKPPPSDRGQADRAETVGAGTSEGGERRADGEDDEAQQREVDATTSQRPAAQRPTQRWVRRRHYKIQEVIRRRQIILVQVVKEERGNKGAALTTYLSLAGRYCVLMPNTPRGGGISRKITNANDRKRLKSAAQALELPEGMGLIIRTAGENRTKAEIKRDYEYLLRMWDTIREITLKSNAPGLRLRGKRSHQARHPRPLQQGRRRKSSSKAKTATATPRNS